MTSNHCLPWEHFWYYANMIMHWRCSNCGELSHRKPRLGGFRP